KIYDLTESAAASTTPMVNGILLSGGTAVTAVNNLIGDLKAPASSSGEAIRGISVTSTTALTTYNLYYNTIYLSASSSGANFGTSGIFHRASATATTAALDLRDNIIDNVSIPAGTGLTVAHRRSAADLANYAGSSNNNDFYAGTPGAANLIYDDNAGGQDQTLGAYQVRVATRDSASVAQIPSFLSTSCGSASFLH